MVEHGSRRVTAKANGLHAGIRRGKVIQLHLVVILCDFFILDVNGKKVELPPQGDYYGGVATDSRAHATGRLQSPYVLHR